MSTMNIHHVDKIETHNEWIARPGDEDYPAGLLVTKITIEGGEGKLQLTCFGRQNAEPIEMQRGRTL